MPKIVDHKTRYQELGKIAAFAMAEHGPDKLTFAQLAKEAECSVGAITYYVKSKDQILLMAGRYIAEDMLQRLNAIKGRYSGLALLRQTLYELLPFNSPHARMRDIAFAMWSKVNESPEIREAVQLGYKILNQTLADIIRTVQKTGDFPEHLDAKKIANKTLTYMDGLVVQIRIAEKNISSRQQCEHVDDWIEQLLNSKPVKSKST